MADNAKAAKTHSKADKPSSARRGHPRKRWTVRILALLLSLVLAEALLRLLCYLSPEVDMALSPPSKYLSLTLAIPDSKLRYRGNPQYRLEHDALGFRNPQLSPLPDSRTVVAIGDSQTYGTSVDWRQAWPQQFERQSGLTTYNMGCSGWGPVEYREILSDALKFKPKLIIVGFYFGNDVFDAFRDAYFWPTGVDLCDPQQHDAIQDLERRDPIRSRIEKLYKAMQERGDAPQDTPNSAADAESIDRYGKLYALAKATWRVVSGLKRRSEDEQWRHTVSWTQERPNDLCIIDSGPFRTVLTPSYRGVAVDRGDLRIVEGERIAHETLEQIAERCRQAGCELLVVLIPTKEMVYAEVAGDAVNRPDYARLLANEQQAIDATTKFLTERNIAFVDTLLPLRGCFSDGANPYLPSPDGHPSGVGQRAIAISIVNHPLVESLK